MDLKYKDECFKVSYYNVVRSYVYKNKKLLEYSDILGSHFCRRCGQYTYHTLGKCIHRFYNYFDELNKPKMVCCNCGFEDYIPDENDFEISVKTSDNFRHKVFSINSKSFLFRYDPVPHHGRIKRNHDRGGSSKKGLIFASYRKSFDEQILDDFCTISFRDIKIRKIYCESGMECWDYPYRNRVKRSWKRTKKRKQWM